MSLTVTSTATSPPGCRILEWDSAFFGRTIARVDPRALLDDPDGVKSWWAEQRIECTYLLADAADQRACDAAQASGFRLVDVRVTLEARGPDTHLPESGAAIRVAVPADVPAMEAIARTNHRATRFYADGQFPLERCDDLYALWIEKSCAGWADRVFVAVIGDEPVGYLTCHNRGDHGQIGLIGVHSVSRGQGSGRALIHAGRQWFEEQGLDRVSVATQARNTAGLRLYQSAGMTVRSVELWFHRWQ